VLQILAIPPGIAAVCALPEPKIPLFFICAIKRETLHSPALAQVYPGMAGPQASLQRSYTNDLACKARQKFGV
jgi:hypothetical protein